MKIKIFIRHSLGIAALLLFFFTPFYSCKKIDTPTAKQLYAAKFFEKPAESSPGLQAIIDLLRTENDKTGFVNTLPGNAGLPVWNKTISEKPKSNYAARGVLVDQNGNYLIPLSNDEKTLSAFLFAMKKDGKYEFFCYDNNYAYQIVFNDQYSIKQRENIMGLFMSMSNYVFGITQFKSIPIELFAGMEGEKIEEGGKTKQMFLEPPKGTPPVILGSLGVIGTEETCVYKFSGQCNCGPDVVTNTSHCNDWWLGCPFCSISDCQLLIFEEVPGTDPPPTNPNGGTGEGPSNGYPSWGEGQNLAGGPLTPPANGSLPNAPCSNNCAWYTEAPGQIFETGPVNLLTDENGFYYSRIFELNELLSENPFALTPCDELNKIAEFGNMYQSVALQQVPQSVLERFNNINEGYRLLNGTPYFSPLQVQTLEDATGTIVNTDFFPVKITRLPAGFTASSLLEYFRVHMNEFTDDLATFEPLVVSVGDQPAGDHFIDETYLFNSPYQNSVGAIIHIDLPNDGTVVQSGYSQDFTIGQESHSFTFTTVQSMLDAAHPVSGNRRMGIYNYTGTDPARQGEFTFYTMGVDRITNPWFEIANFTDFGDGRIFDGADRLWRTMQQKMIDFIIPNGGAADYYQPKEYTPRADWKDVKEFLLNHITMEQLKRALGC